MKLFWHVIVTIALAVAAVGQVLPGKGIQKGIKFPEYDRQSGKIRSLLTSATALQQKGGPIQLTGVRLETYSYDSGQRKVELVVETPHCLFDVEKRIANSPGAVNVYRTDRRVSLTGEGFLWNSESGLLIVSNNVRTVVFDDDARGN